MQEEEGIRPAHPDAMPAGGGRMGVCMSFKEDIFSKILTYITVAVLLGAMLLEAFVIYRERGWREETQEQLEAAQGEIRNLTQVSLSQTEEISFLQEYRENWENRMILSDDGLLEELRRDLYARQKLIPEEATEAALALVRQRLAEEVELSGQEPAEEEEGPALHFSFPVPEEREWLLWLNRREEDAAFRLLYARASDEENGLSLEFLYEVPLDGTGEAPLYDETGRIVWNCIAFDAGAGWQAYEREEEEQV